jgi:sRNA-binding protein
MSVSDKNEAALALIDAFCAKWPQAFYADPRQRKPLKVGIHNDIHAAMPDISRRTLSRALQYYARHPCYLQAVAKSQPRVDLAGVELGQVSEHERDMAVAELKKWTAKQERLAEAKRKAEEKYKGVTGPNAEKPRLTLKRKTAER